MSYKSVALGTAGIVGLWGLDETVGNMVDAKNGLNGTVSGAPLRGEPSLLPNGEGKSMKFASGKFVQVAHNALLNLADKWTMEAWVKPEVAATSEPWNIMSKGNGAYYSRIDNAANKFMSLRSQVVNLAESTWAALPNEIYYVVFTKNGSTRKVYVNGVDATVLGTNSICINTATALVFGQGDAGFGGVFKGWMQNLAVYNVDISAATVKEHWEASQTPRKSRIAVTRELPPDKLAFRIEPPGGQPKRWAEDEPSQQDVLSDITLADEMPGGCKDAAGTLARDPRVDYGDVRGFSKAYAYQPGVEKVWEGYFDKAPEVSGDKISINPALVGNQKHLEGNNAASLGIIDSDLNKWGDPSIQRRKQLIEAGFRFVADEVIGWRSAGELAPGLIIDFAQVEAVAGYNELGEHHYYGEGIDIGAIRFDWRNVAGAADENFDNTMGLGNNDTFTSSDVTASFKAATETNKEIKATVEGRKFARMQAAHTGAFVGAMTNCFAAQNVRVLGNHGLVPKGTWPNIGFTAHQILSYGVPLLAAPLRIDPEFMDDDEYVIVQAWYANTNTGEMVRDVVKYSLFDWFVYFEELFQYRQPGSYGRFWKAYMGPSELNEQGLDSERLWESIVVQYTDVDGTTRTVGPPGSGANVEDARLQIIDHDHPAVRAELTRRDLLDLKGIGTPETAVAVGVRFLEESTLLPRSGSATLSGYVLDSHGNLRPAAQVRSGDWISFVDASDTSYRKIVSKNYSHGSRGAEIDVDAPPSGLEALLERLQSDLVGLGVT